MTDNKHRITSIRIGKGREVQVQDLLMKLAVSEDLIRLSCMAEDGLTEPLNKMTWSAIQENLFDVAHALECALSGYEMDAAEWLASWTSAPIHTTDVEVDGVTVRRVSDIPPNKTNLRQFRAAVREKLRKESLNAAHV